MAPASARAARYPSNSALPRGDIPGTLTGATRRGPQGFLLPRA